MTTDQTSRTLWTIAALAATAWLIWLVRDILPPFLMAVALALLLDPLLDRMQARGCPRAAAVVLVFGGFLALLFGVTAFLVPIAVGQIGDLIRNLDTYASRVQEVVDAWTRQNQELLRRMNMPLSLPDLWRQYQGQITQYAQSLLGQAFGALQASAGTLSWLVVVPIVTLYLLMDIDRLAARIYYILSERHREVAIAITSRVGSVFGAYLRGLTLICAGFGLAVFAVLGLVFGLKYSVILALGAFALYAVPYLGQLTLLLVACGVAWATGRPAPYIVGIAVSLVALGQLFDQLITPRFIGKQVGLHPVLGLFALMAGGHLFGLAGMVIAVPVAASVRAVLVYLFPRLGEPIPEAVDAVPLPTGGAARTPAAEDAAFAEPGG